MSARPPGRGLRPAGVERGGLDAGWLVDGGEPVASAGAPGVQRTAVRWKVRTAAAVSATANRATTPRLSDAIAV